MIKLFKESQQLSSVVDYLDSHLSEVLSGQSLRLKCTENHTTHLRKLYVLEDTSTGTKWVIKESRMGVIKKTLQMAAILRVSQATSIVVLPLGILEIDGQVFCLWEYVKKADTELTYPKKVPSHIYKIAWKLWTTNVFDQGELKDLKTLRPDIFDQLNGSDGLSIEYTSKFVTDILYPTIDYRLLDTVESLVLRANSLLQNNALLNDYRQLPLGFVHTDIRDENIIGSKLIDADNFRADARIIELIRLVLLNSKSPYQFIRCLQKVQVDFSGVLLPEEKRCIVPILLLDMFALHKWMNRKHNEVTPTHRKWMQSLFIAHIRGLQYLIKTKTIGEIQYS